MKDAFLTARWRHLVMLNYAVDPELLAARVPAGTVLDTSEGSHWVSVVGFLFLDTRLKGVPVPFHTDFEELNLRFYVRREVPDETRGQPVRRGVVFVRELVPKPAIALVARLAYNEAYSAVPMNHAIERPGGPRDRLDPLQPGDTVRYGFRLRGSEPEWGEVSATVDGPSASLEPGSHAEFIAKHYWGYARQRDGGTVEYEVTHPPWEAHPVGAHALSGDLETLYGSELGAALSRPADSAFVAVGSEISVGVGRRLDEA